MVGQKMVIKHLMPSGLIIMVVCMSCSSASSQPSPQESAQFPNPTPVAENPDATWGNDMTRASLLRDSADTKVTMAVVEASLSAGQEAYARYRIGNLAFVEIMTLPHPEEKDVNATHQYVAVILGDKPRLVSLPDKVLFAHFAKNIRPNPDKIDSRNRIRTALLLATDSGSYEDEPTPTWTDEGGTLIIHYRRYVNSSNTGKSYPILQECTLIVDVNQDFTLKCIERK